MLKHYELPYLEKLKTYGRISLVCPSESANQETAYLEELITGKHMNFQTSLTKAIFPRE